MHGGSGGSFLILTIAILTIIAATGGVMFFYYHKIASVRASAQANAQGLQTQLDKITSVAQSNDVNLLQQMTDNKTDFNKAIVANQKSDLNNLDGLVTGNTMLKKATFANAADIVPSGLGLKIGNAYLGASNAFFDGDVVFTGQMCLNDFCISQDNLDHISSTLTTLSNLQSTHIGTDRAISELGSNLDFANADQKNFVQKLSAQGAYATSVMDTLDSYKITNNSSQKQISDKLAAYGASSDVLYKQFTSDFASYKTSQDAINTSYLSDFNNYKASSDLAQTSLTGTLSNYMSVSDGQQQKISADLNSYYNTLSKFESDSDFSNKAAISALKQATLAEDAMMLSDLHTMQDSLRGFESGVASTLNNMQTQYNMINSRIANIGVVDEDINRKIQNVQQELAALQTSSATYMAANNLSNSVKQSLMIDQTLQSQATMQSIQASLSNLKV
jgi:hypothetical protein